MRRWRPAQRSAAAIRAFDSLAAAAGVGAIASTARASLLAVAGGLAGEGLEEGWVVLAQQRAQFVGGPGAAPGGVLVCAGQYCDRLDQVGVGRRFAVDVLVGAQDVGQRHRVGVVGLATAHRVPFAVAGDGHRVDRIDRTPGGPQRRDQ
jgi:hypothetical protein